MCYFWSCVKTVHILCVYPGIPQECLPFLERCVKNKHIDILPDQLTVNQYKSGQGEFYSRCFSNDDSPGSYYKNHVDIADHI